MRTTPPEPFVSTEEVFDVILAREIQRVAERTLTSREYAALMDFAQKPRKRMPKRVQKAVAKVRVAMGIGEDAQAEKCTK